MNDHLLSSWSTKNERVLEIIKYIKNKKLLGESVDLINLKDKAMQIWHDHERRQSWPFLLGVEANVPVFNLAKVGGSLGYSLLNFQKFCESLNKDYEKICVIHQIPYEDRMFLKFNRKIGRINVQPSSTDFGYHNYQMEVDNVHQVYKNRVLKKGYVEKFFNKLLYKLHGLSKENKMDDYYIFFEQKLIPDFLKGKVIIAEFEKFWRSYKRGPLQHPIEKKFSVDLIEKCKSTLF